MNNDYKKCCFFNDTHQTPRCNVLNKLFCLIEPDKKCAFFQTMEERKERDRKYGKPEELKRYDS